MFHSIVASRRSSLVVIAFAFLAAGVAVSLAQSSKPQGAAPMTDPAAHRAPTFVVELFTSQGCSSCPPADELLEKLDSEWTKKGQSGLFLSFHVDYWDRLGWKDPFSSGAFSERQRLYAGAFRASSVYTPQMIVNGAAEFVGSDRSAAERAIGKAVKSPLASLVQIRKVSLSDQRDRVIVEHVVEEAGASAVLHIAVVERGLSTAVGRGENSGRTLRHHNVVRAFLTRTGRETSGVTELSLPPGLKPAMAGVVAYLQDPQSMAIRGAAHAPLP